MKQRCICSALLMLFSAAICTNSFAVQVTVGSGTAKSGQTVTIPITVDVPNEIAGAAFTLSYDKTKLALTSMTSTFFDTFSNQWNSLMPLPDPLPPGEVTVNGVKYNQPLLKNLISTGTIVSASRCKAGATITNLFNVSFTIAAETPSGKYPITILPTTLSNTAAGYSSTGEVIPVLVGAIDGETDLKKAYPAISATLISGQVTVQGRNTIASSAGTGGKINPNGNVLVTYGENQIFTITPDTGYRVNTVTVDGAPASPAIPQQGGTYTFTAVTTNHTISASFIQKAGSVSQFWGIWPDGVYSWDKTTNKWTKMSSTSNAIMIAAGKIDSDGIDDLIGVWSTGLYVRQSANGQWLKLSTTLPTWIAAGDINNDGRDDVIGSWKNDAVYYRDSATGKWIKLSSAAKQLAAGNIGGVRDDLAGVWSDGLWVRFSATAAWQKIDASIPVWIAVGDISGDKQADIVGSYSTGTWYRNSATKAWTKITTPAEQITVGDLDGDGRDDLIGIWSNGVYVRYGATNQWQLITTSKPKWITTGKIAEALQSTDALNDLMESPGGNDMIDLSQEGPDVLAADTVSLDEDSPAMME